MTDSAPGQNLLEAALEFEGVLRACLRRYVHNAAEVEDLLQETYAQLLQAGAPGGPQVLSVRAFALGIARHLALNWMRRQRIVPMDSIGDLEDLGGLDEGEQVERIVSAEQEIALLMQAVQALPDKCRQVFTLRKVYGFSQKEIAARMGISENTVEQHLTKAGRRCAQFLFEHSSVRESGSSMLSGLKGHWRSHDDRK